MGRSTGLVLAGLLSLFFCGQTFSQNAPIDVEIEGGGGGDSGGGGNIKSGSDPHENKKNPKCGEGSCVVEKPTKAQTSPAKTPEQIAQEQKLEADKEFDESVKNFVYEKELEKGDAPLEDARVILDKLEDLLKDRVKDLVPVPPIVHILKALKPDVVGTSPFDKVKSKEEMKLLRGQLDYEKKTQEEDRRTNEAAYQENLKRFKLDGHGDEPKAPVIRAPASRPYGPEGEKVMASIQKLSILKGDDFSAITEHVISRGYKGADIPISENLQRKIVKALSQVTIANVCQIKGRACYVNGAALGDSCYCPQPTSKTTFIKINGYATRVGYGNYCRNGDTSSQLNGYAPIGTICHIPVDLSVQYGYPHVENILGKVSKYSCESWAEKHSEHCE